MIVFSVQLLIMKFKILVICLFFMFAFTACGSDDSGKVSKGHRDAIHIECDNDPDKKLCGAEVRNSFIEDGNEFAVFNELNKDQKRRVKMECVRSKKYGLESYNNCLEDNIELALTGDLTNPRREKKPKNNIEDLEKSVVFIVIAEAPEKKGDKEKFHGTGSGVILDKNLIATNCHVALVAEEGPRRSLWVNNVNDPKKWSLAKIYKKNKEKDICILKHSPLKKLSLSMKPIRGVKKFSKLKRGDFVRTLGSPEGLIAHTAEGSIQYLGTFKNLRTVFENADEFEISDDTKIIIHGAKIGPGSSGGPLFDKDGRLVGLNTLGGPGGSVAENITVSADYIQEMLK